jgi:hypothetical protein
MKSITIPLIGFIILFACRAWATEPPCDHYPLQKQRRCEIHWKQINDEAVGEMVEFGSTQLKRREAGTITPEQHLQQNMDFIKHSAEKRLELLNERMDKEK